MDKKNNNIVYIVIKIIIYNNKFLYNIKIGIKYNIYALRYRCYILNY